ncbi:hypothetical protein XA68_11477 [Ophiocordyceps unilateralis]|uniref:Uncharacterized protein n=1 Tax=Ophiocordyceps unilateralis TaxID=268505 RepID=A0A2A9PFC2_OPHUN|nr:hypothetical protein XA68_11477 [Ophiocordyceps unilateralis]
MLRRRPLLLSRPLPAPRLLPKTRLSSTSRIDRLASKLPARWQKHATRLRNAPVSHVAAFLILHEITAVVPLLALFALFHYTAVVPVEWVAGRFAAYTDEGVARAERYFRRKDWFGFRAEEGEAKGKEEGDNPGQDHTKLAIKRWERGDGGYQILVEVALAYAVTKALLPLRIVASLLATPWFARVITSIGSSLFRKP